MLFRSTLPLLVSLACLGMLGAAQAQPGPQAHATLPTVVVSSTQNNLLADDLPHAGVLVAVCDLLPGASPQTRAEVQARFGQVQPIELVGLDPSLPSGLALVDARSLR